MNTEIEVKFVNVNIDEVRQNLQSAGGVLEQPMRLMRRVTFDNDFMQQGKDGFLRVRDEGQKVTMTYKQFNESSLTGTKEIEIEVSSFDDAVAILEQAGIAGTSFQESKRETWRVNNTEVVIDVWPWLEPYIEVEGDSEAVVAETSHMLGFNMEDGIYGGVDKVYELKYEFLNGVRGVIDIPEVRFDSPIPADFKGRS